MFWYVLSFFIGAICGVMVLAIASAGKSDAEHNVPISWCDTCVHTYKEKPVNTRRPHVLKMRRRQQWNYQK